MPNIMLITRVSLWIRTTTSNCNSRGAPRYKALLYNIKIIDYRKDEAIE